ncbi:secreted RxLR effector protein 161-like [Hevea brasiliensis]|uniref:secreted RxLR effector protein 161-like n=1 Tax=Hevea brasiliensis TaxID=3981 RepID=UPI0025DC0BB0|nr:secreted RxLR effector protein 161-like [Hevea brasiliensis]
MGQSLKNEIERESMKVIPYASAIRSLMYAQVCSRPNIAFAIGVLGRYQSNTGKEHWITAKRVMRYLKGITDYMLTYKQVEHLELVGYTNSEFADCSYNQKSTSGYVFMLAGGAVSWKSVKQTIVSSSKVQVEFIACYDNSANNRNGFLQKFFIVSKQLQ